MKDLRIQDIIDKAYNKVKGNNQGKLASYIPELTKVDPKLFGICFVDCQGNIYEVGKSRKTIPIESISKVFSLAMASQELGISKVNRKIGNEGSSLPFNSVVACVLSKTHTINPFVNQGALATTSLFYRKNKEAFRNKILINIDKYAGRKLRLDNKVYKSEMKTNNTNMALAYLLKSFDRLYGDVNDTVDVYTQQCSKLVSAKDLATMACVFAKGGVHPHTKKRILNKTASEYVYRSLRGEGLYEYSGRWDTDVGCVSAKSGVGGGLFIILKGIGGIGIVSPPLDKIGNSVRGIKAGKIISKKIIKLTNKRVHFCPNKTIKKKRKNRRKTKKNRR
ncbi:glutaminase A [Crocinitomicaceae bacterium]|nr:glutaminase A [Crocinitomicaceae bacterium]